MSTTGAAAIAASPTNPASARGSKTLHPESSVENDAAKDDEAPPPSPLPPPPSPLPPHDEDDSDDEDDGDNQRFEEEDAAAALAAATKNAAAAAPAPEMNEFVYYPKTAAMADPAAADLAVDVAAHGDVVLAARETQDTVCALATLFAMKGGGEREILHTSRVGDEDCAAAGRIHGCCRRCWTWRAHPAPSGVHARQCG